MQAEREREGARAEGETSGMGTDRAGGTAEGREEQEGQGDGRASAGERTAEQDEQGTDGTRAGRTGADAHQRTGTRMQIRTGARASASGSTQGVRTGEGRKRAREHEEETTERVGRPRETGGSTRGAADGSSRSSAAGARSSTNESDGCGPGKETRPLSQRREKREREAPHTGYDEVRRRKARKTRTTTAYVERGNRARGGGLKRAIAIGAATVERIVRGRYEWRDGGLQPMIGARRAWWRQQERI